MSLKPALLRLKIGLAKRANTIQLIIGLALVGAGLWYVSPPAAAIMFGVMLMAEVILSGRRRQE